MLAHRNTRFLVANVFVCCSLGLGLPISAKDSAKRSAEKPTVVIGHVANVDGKPIAGATVEWGHAKTPFKQRTRVETDADGKYKLVLKSLEGHGWLAASAPDYASSIGSLQLKQGLLEHNFVLSAISEKSHVAAGEVVDQHNHPIAGARVEARTAVTGFYSSFSMPTGGDYFPGPDRVCTTDDQGKFRIADLPVNEVQLSVQSKHRYVNDKNYPVEEGLAIMMSGSGQPGVVQGHAVDATTDKPPENLADVRIVSRYSTMNHKCSSEDGTFRIPGEVTLGGKYTVYVYAKGYAATSAEILSVPAESTDFAKIELHPHPALRGKLVDAGTGEPLGNIPILYGVADEMRYMEWSDLPRYAEGHHFLTLVQHSRTNPQGEFWFAEPKSGSRGAMIISASGYQRLILHARNRQRDEATGEVLIRLQRESAFKGVVLVDGKPATNTSVSISGKSVDGIDQMYENTRTDAMGKYRYGRLTPGNYRIRCEKYSRTAKVGKGETATINLGNDLGPLRIHGRLEPEMSMHFSPQFPWDYTEFKTTSNAQGEYEISGLKAGRYSVWILDMRPSGYMTRRTQEIVVKSDNQQIDLLPKPTVRKK